MADLPNITQVEYMVPGNSQGEGVLLSLVPQLSQTLQCDHLSLDQIPPSTLAALTFRRGAKKFFQLRLICQGGRYLLKLSGIQSTRVREGMRLCRDHFDRWFGITGQEIMAFERSRLVRKRLRKKITP